MTLWNEALKIIAYIPTSLVTYYVMAYLLEIKRRWPYMLGMTALHIVFQLLYMLAVAKSVPGAEAMKTISQTGVYLLGAFAFARVSFGRKLLAYSLAQLAVLAGELLSVLTFTQLGGVVGLNGVAEALKDPFIYLFMQTVNLVVVSLLGAAIIYLWNRFFLRTTSQSIGYFILFPASQIVWLSICGYYAGHGVFERSSYIAMSIGILFSIGADLLILRGASAFSKRAVAEERANWYEALLEQQSTYYEQILLDVEDASRIRHDIRNQLQTIYTLLEQGQNETAQRLLDEASDALRHTRQFCANRVVNALLNVKAEQYDRAGIALACECDVPESLPLQGVELCSLFSNVLDNALNAARLSKISQPVRLTAGLQKGYFILICKNPYSPGAPRKQPSEHQGLGLPILTDLAGRYDGDLKTEQSNGTFTTRVWLKMPDTES